MKGSEVIIEIQKLIDKHGDLEVGFLNIINYSFESIGAIKLRKRTAMSEKIGYSDDEKLGGEFIGIRY